MKISRNTSIFALWAVIVSIVLAGCSTGIEGTGTIRMNRSERREAQPSPEQHFVAQLKSEPLGSWELGHRFVVTDNKFALLLEKETGMPSNPDHEALCGDTLRFAGTELRATPGGGKTVIAVLYDGRTKYLYNTLRDEKGAATLTALDMPMVIDLNLVERGRTLLAGKQLWTRSAQWIDSADGNLTGKKYVPVTVSEVSVGNQFFPMRVQFTDENEIQASVFMNVRTGDSNIESRTFETLFSLTDPRLKYPGITDDNWKLIQSGRVVRGMTKEECRLSLGNPDEVDAGHSWSTTIDLWKYKDGTFLRFEDGLLYDYR